MIYNSLPGGTSPILSSCSGSLSFMDEIMAPTMADTPRRGNEQVFDDNPLNIYMKNYFLSNITVKFFSLDVVVTVDLS